VDNLESDAVLTDNVAGAHAAAQHLIELGHRRIAIILGRERVSNTQERFDGFCRALAEADLPLDRSFVQQGRYRLEGGYQATIALLKGDNPPSAIVSTNNLMTIGALEAIRDSNLRCPQDVSLVGFDEGVWSRISDPKLTTVVQDPYEIGHRAVQLLFERLRGGGPRHPQVIRIPAQLKVRASTAAPADGGQDRGAR
jgi:LacI family transcriptional regulator